MLLKQISLQNFRSYNKSEFSFGEGTTLIVGPNTSGKSNLIEAIYLLSTGKSFRAQNDGEMIQFEKDIARVSGEIRDLAGQGNSLTKLEFLLTPTLKKYMVNGIIRRRIDFAGNLVTVLFSPVDLDMVVGGPAIRRMFLDEVIEQVDRDYRHALVIYSKALRQRNSLLDQARKEGMRDERNFAYWDEILIENGQIITKKREECIAFLNSEPKEIFPCTLLYDKSTISQERLEQYKDAEVGAGVTLVGPHRDDFIIKCKVQSEKLKVEMDVKLFGSRGQQRLAVLQLTLLQLVYIERRLGFRPVLLLDDIFSELDEAHIHHVFSLIQRQQTILTTTHEEFVDKKHLKDAAVIKLE